MVFKNKKELSKKYHLDQSGETVPAAGRSQ
jgi:hypothetical protein